MEKETIKNELDKLFEMITAYHKSIIKSKSSNIPRMTVHSKLVTFEWKIKSIINDLDK